MKARPFLIGLVAGVYFTALVSFWRLQHIREDFNIEAFNHGAMMYYADIHTGRITRWQWMDDWSKDKLSCPSYTPPPTPGTVRL